MTDDVEFETGDSEPGAIGVGMGGSCPTCRAPVDLGQEFCLECGSPIRFTPRQRKPQRGRSEGQPSSGRRSPAPAKGGFPWIPMLVVLALVGGGSAFALVDGGDDTKTSARDTTEDALPTITNSAPTETESDTETTTVEDCSSVAPIDDTVPAIGETGTDTAPTDPTTGLPGEEIPELGSDGFSDPGVPSTDPGSSSSDGVTVDVNGNLCPVSGSGSDPTDSSGGTSPTDTLGTTDTTGTTSTPASTGAQASGDWPAGEEGFTVIVAGYPNDEDRARQVAADLQEDGFTDGGVLNSSDFSSLCPGYFVVFSGTFDSRRQAERRLDELSAKDYAGMYVREIKPGGSSPSDCTQARPQN